MNRETRERWLRWLGVIRTSSLPLAIDPARTRALEAYRLRRAAAVEQLHRNIGGDLDGRRIEDIKDLLPTVGLPNAQAEMLLQEIEALDGSDRSKWSVLFLFEKLRAAGTAMPESDAPALPEVHRTSRKWLVGAVLAVSALLLVGWLVKSELTEKPVKLEPSKSEPTEQSVAGPAVVKPEPSKAEPTKQSVAGPLVVKPEQPKSEPTKQSVAPSRGAAEGVGARAGLLPWILAAKPRSNFFGNGA